MCHWVLGLCVVVQSVGQSLMAEYDLTSQIGLDRHIHNSNYVATVVVPLSTASDEDPAPDPNATYPQVNIGQKRASWKQRERTPATRRTVNQLLPDSWV